MSMYIWLKPEAEKTLTQLTAQGKLGKVHLWDDSSSGKKYLRVYADVCDPTAEVPALPAELIDRVTAQEEINDNFRMEGLYEHEGATLMVKTRVRLESSGSMSFEGTVERLTWQEFHGSAPTFEKLRTIFNKVRRGQLSPTENWGNPQHVPSPGD